MSVLYTEHHGEARRALAFDTLYRPRAAELTVPDNAALYHHAADVVGKHEPVTYLEFGVAEGASLRKMIREFTHPDSLFVGFDSFVGLPEDWMMHRRGVFTNRGATPVIDDSRVRYVKGWFQNTLLESLSWLNPRLSGHVLVHYDADLYSSTLFLLASLWPHCRKYHFIMDDFMVDDIVALHDFSLSYPVLIEFLACREGGVPHSVLGSMTRIEFTIPVSEASPKDILARAGVLASIGQFDAALELWRILRETHPLQTDAWLAAGKLLRDLGRFDEAEAMLNDARSRFPTDPVPLVEWAALAHSRRDWPEALRRWELVRGQYPNTPRPYVNAGLALRELGRLDEAESVLNDAGRRFPSEPEPFIEFAWIAHIRRDWLEAVRRWDFVLERFPGQVGPYVGGGVALRELGRLDAADARLATARQKFPADRGAAIEYGWIATVRRDWAEARSRWTYAHEKFPDDPAPFAGDGLALRELGQFDQAESLLADARQRFPRDPGVAIEYALVAHVRRDWPEALRRWTDARATAPLHPAGYCWGAHALRALDRTADAEMLLREACALFPLDVVPAIDLARFFEESGDWAETERCWQEVTTRFPERPEGPVGVAAAQRRQGRLEAAEALIEAAIARLPGAPTLAEQHGLNAMAREDFATALTRLEAAQQRFPADTGIRQRLYEVRMRVAESGGAPVPATAGVGTDSDRELVLNFESLGGGGHGCEFGIFQRAMGAEPLGLLRWADLDQHQLIAALDTEFEGVGEPEFTRVFAPATTGCPQYWTTDTRYHMAMNSFVNVDDVPLERMSKLVHQRMKFLRAKLIDDLRSGQKIFVYKNMRRDLTGAELAALHASVRRYGDNTLFYIRYQDHAHPNGTVEWLNPHLLVGYIDHFSHTPDTDELIAPVQEQFLALCRRAYVLWRARPAI